MGPFNPPSVLTQLLASPLVFFLRPIYSLLSAIRPAPYTHSSSQTPVRVVCISDTHTLRPSHVPDGDLLIHAGDLTNAGTVEEIQDMIDWLKTLPHKHKIIIAGNHDGWLDENVRDLVIQSASASVSASTKDDVNGTQQVLDWGDIHYLQNSSITLPFTSSSSSTRDLVIHGVPQIPQLSPEYPSIHAFEYPPSLNLNPNARPWPNPIPAETDILISHSPPLHHRDLFPNSVGCPHLLDAVWCVKPALHVFGHAHGGRGVEPVYYDEAQRAWERLCGRRQERGVIWERGGRSWFWWLCNWLTVRGGILGGCMDGLAVIWGAGKAVLWLRVWGGERPLGREGWMVNAACMDGWVSGKLTGKGAVVDI